MVYLRKKFKAFSTLFMDRNHLVQQVNSIADKNANATFHFPSISALRLLGF